MSTTNAKRRAAPGNEALVPIPAIPQAALKRSEFVRNSYQLVLPARTPYEELFGDRAAAIVDPVAALLTRGDLVELIPESGEFFALLLVAEMVRGKHVRFVELLKQPMGSEAVDSLEGTREWRAGWLGWSRGYAVISPTGTVSRDGLRTREEAEADAHQRNKPNFARGTLA